MLALGATLMLCACTKHSDTYSKERRDEEDVSKDITHALSSEEQNLVKLARDAVGTGMKIPPNVRPEVRHEGGLVVVTWPYYNPKKTPAPDYYAQVKLTKDGRIVEVLGAQ